jgi:nucleoside-diphosphate-sugar epimerase
MNIGVTGASGFIGSSLCAHLLENHHNLKCSVRDLKKSTLQKKDNLKIVVDGNIHQKNDWLEFLSGTECIIHCANLTRTIKKKDEFILNEVNVKATENLAKQAAVNGVKRLIFLSSVKVNGERTVKSSSFKFNDFPQPQNAYGISKLEAEQALWKISKQTGLEIVIIRAPLVYGENVKGNFLSLLNLIDKGIPLPFAGVNNLRSFVGLDNLIDLIICCIDNPKAAGQIFLVSDGEDLSTSDLIKKIAEAMGKTPRLFSLPIFILKFIGRIIGKSLETDRLLDSLQVDSSYTHQILGWRPPFSIDEGLLKTVKWYLRHR